MTLKKVCALAGLLVAFGNISFALQPGFSVQGRLTDALGNPKNGSFKIMFSVYQNETPGEVSPVWAKTFQNVAVTNGNFQVLLEGAGDDPLLTIENAVKELPGAYVEVKVGEESPMTPRLPLVRSAFSPTKLVAKNDALIHSETGNISLKTGNDEKIVVLNNGNVGIGTNSPDAKLTVNGGVKITDGTQGDGKVFTSDAAGNATWKAAPAVDGGGVLVVSDVRQDDNGESGYEFCEDIVVASVQTTLKGGRLLVINAFATVGADTGRYRDGRPDGATPWVVMFLKKDGEIVSSRQWVGSGAGGNVGMAYVWGPYSFVYSEPVSQEGLHTYELVLSSVEMGCGHWQSPESPQTYGWHYSYYAARGLVLTEY